MAIRPSLLHDLLLTQEPASYYNLIDDPNYLAQFDIIVLYKLSADVVTHVSTAWEFCFLIQMNCTSFCYFALIVIYIPCG